MIKYKSRKQQTYFYFNSMDVAYEKNGNRKKVFLKNQKILEYAKKHKDILQISTGENHGLRSIVVIDIDEEFNNISEIEDLINKKIPELNQYQYIIIRNPQSKHAQILIPIKTVRIKDEFLNSTPNHELYKQVTRQLNAMIGDTGYSGWQCKNPYCTKLTSQKHKGKRATLQNLVKISRIKITIPKKTSTYKKGNIETSREHWCFSQTLHNLHQYYHKSDMDLALMVYNQWPEECNKFEPFTFNECLKAVKAARKYFVPNWSKYTPEQRQHSIDTRSTGALVRLFNVMDTKTTQKDKCNSLEYNYHVVMNHKHRVKDKYHQDITFEFVSKLLVEKMYIFGNTFNKFYSHSYHYNNFHKLQSYITKLYNIFQNTSKYLLRIILTDRTKYYTSKYYENEYKISKQQVYHSNKTSINCNTGQLADMALELTS